MYYALRNVLRIIINIIHLLFKKCIDFLFFTLKCFPPIQSILNKVLKTNCTYAGSIKCN